MIPKYRNQLRIDTTKKVRYNLSVLPSIIPTEDIPFYYISRGGDRLDTISNLFYKTPKNWWIIAKVNNLANGSMAVGAGTKLFIPNIN